MRWLWLAVGWTALGLGAAGIFVPLLPATPFLLLAALCFARSSPRLHHWLLTHPRLSPPIHHWQRHRAIARSTKIVATVLMLATLAVSAALGIPDGLLYIQGTVLAGVTGFVLSRREPPPGV